MSKQIRLFILTAALLLTSGILFAQSSPESQPAPAVVSAAPADAGGTAQGEHPSKFASPGDKPVENADEEENSQFKYSPLERSVA